ncbi:helix-turn-helix domain-containing protein [Candidatus Omnitrophota bacterium]
MPEKLLTLKEVSVVLGIPEEEVKRLSGLGEIPAYKVGGKFLRFRKEQIDAIREEIFKIEASRPLMASGRPTAATGPAERLDYSFFDRIADFFHFNDFYIFSFVVISIILYFIFR